MEKSNCEGWRERVFRPWWRRVVEKGGGEGWWRRVVEKSGGEGWWKKVEEIRLVNKVWWRYLWWRRGVGDTLDGEGVLEIRVVEKSAWWKKVLEISEVEKSGGKR
ncbi:hypothetical protein Pmani_019608 [Petrolisthes manimaculis]|uniref:Uncharacterized protein n=1 Tax=Petrolisthes manimaculis TaxID=1843537 RepID=A0AAE1PIJ6_9EUCA|nr:hypothetical protein Pmani_019608 [Petrolisthes manimaculis]